MKAGDEHLLYLLQLIRENPTAYPVPGIGLGASERARRWASLGMIIDNERFWPLVENAIASYGIASEAEFENRRKVGRPNKGELGSKDCWRAYTLWRLRKQYPQCKTVKSLVNLAAQFEKILKRTPTECGFYLSNTDNIEQSVSRGKKALGIDRNWHSETCEQFEAN